MPQLCRITVLHSFENISRGICNNQDSCLWSVTGNLSKWYRSGVMLFKFECLSSCRLWIILSFELSPLKQGLFWINDSAKFFLLSSILAVLKIHDSWNWNIAWVIINKFGRPYFLSSFLECWSPLQCWAFLHSPLTLIHPILGTWASVVRNGRCTCRLTGFLIF